MKQGVIFTTIIHHIIREHDITLNQYILLERIRYFQGKAGKEWCFESRASQAKFLQCSPRFVSKMLQQLEEKGMAKRGSHTKTKVTEKWFELLESEPQNPFIAHHEPELELKDEPEFTPGMNQSSPLPLNQSSPKYRHISIKEIEIGKSLFKNQTILKKEIGITQAKIFLDGSIRIPESPKLQTALLDWLSYKWERGESYRGKKGLQAVLNKFEKVVNKNKNGEQDIIDGIERTKRNNWAGLFINGNKKEISSSPLNYEYNEKEGF